MNTGARLRDYHLARELARYASVTYLGLRNPHDPPAISPPPESGFERYIIIDKETPYTPFNLLRGAVGPAPVTVLNCRSARVAAELNRILSDGAGFDSVQIEGMHLVEYLPLLRDSRAHPALIGDWHNIESEIMRRFSRNNPGLAKRAYARRTAQLIENMEMRLLRGCDVNVTTSSRERDKLRARLNSARIEIVGNGVDVAHYAGPHTRAERLDVLFVGSMDYHANIEAVRGFAVDTWPELLAAYPEMRFVIVGRNPSAEVLALGTLPHVEVAGTVDDVRPWYGSAFVVVVPLRTGSGTRLKILEAMAAGVPVVSTPLGAEGLDVTDGSNIILAETAGQTVEAVELLSKSPARWHGIVEAGRRLVRDRYDWSILGAQLYKIHETAVHANYTAAGRHRSVLSDRPGEKPD